ncbi:MAG: hypothetical protein COV66_09080 [Nitrospinae bacterium CG11_big_fil_rev_8_21_14_0_20_45_15]|nr:MAG: hypothetical protein COV66_09080 [Nitrospinae bacterium CG11_big_fil_rev_8_21_14_0_20_45_15]
MNLKFSLFICFLTLIFPTIVLGKSINGKVIAVSSGDNITILSDNDIIHKIRLANIDAPELKQPFGRQSRNFTEELAMDMRVRVNYQIKDYHNRLIGDVVLPNGKLLNEEMIRYGYAWHYRVKRPPSQIFSNLEYQAWKNKLGLWVQDKPIPPWEFRRGNDIPLPPSKPEYTDYDEIFSYGILGDPKSRIYYWPACRKYPTEHKGLIIFGSKLDAEVLGFRISKTCPQ